MILLSIVIALIGSIIADPYAEFRSNLEFLNGDTNLAEPRYRLLDNVQPTHLNVDLDVYLAESRFNGHVTIVVEVNENGLTQIVVHQKVVAITAVSVLNSEDQPVPLQFPNAFETDDYYEILIINFDAPITTGTYTISITYLGQINENPLDRGFYKGYYFLNDEVHQYATTQFQPYHARKAFPCFDEPQFKSQYVLSITRDSGLSPSYSNMAIHATDTVAPGRIRETFDPTPIISAYLIAFHVSDFVETTTTGTEEKPFGIISRQGATNQHAYAADIGLRITNELDDYLDFGYYNMGQGQSMKNDHIALPDFPSGAMENWGMVNYREAYLLYDDDNTNLQSKIFIATIMAHELAHKWFGNLVTCFWWSNLWLNESYASFFEYFAAHFADPGLELADQFIVDYVHSALNWDAGAGATPMNWTAVSDNPSITAHFSTTSYAKGASVLRMMEHFVGADNFKNALRYYIRDNAYGIGTPGDMYAAFRTAAAEDATFAQAYGDIDVGAVFDSWVQTPGSPVLEVSVDMNTGVITITQRRFQLTGTPPNSIWRIPVTWTHSGNPNFVNLRPAFVMTDRTVFIQKEPGHHWVIMNIAQSGLYRVNYDHHNWEMIADALREDRESIHRLNRAQIVNDVLYFIRGDRIQHGLALEIFSFLKDETDYYVWAGALGQIDWIHRRLEHIPVVHQEYTEWMLENIETALEELGFEEGEGESTSTILNRMQLANYACHNIKHQGCIDHSVERWRQYRENEAIIVPANERRYVYCEGLRHGDASDYQFLFEKYETAENTADMVVILRALACTRNRASFEHYLQSSLYNDKIRIHDKTNAFSYALQGNKENLPLVLDFVYNNFREIEYHYGGSARLNIALNALSTYLTDFNHIVEFQTWLYRNQLELPESFNTGVSVINTSINNLEWGNRYAGSLLIALRERSSATHVTMSVVVLLTAAFVHLFK